MLIIPEDTRDSLQGLNLIGDIPENGLLVWFDVVGLYPHIPHDQGVKIMGRFLDKREDHSVSSESLCKVANIVLKHNYFQLGKDVYHQILGTVIRTKFAPHYANIFMAGVEEQIFEISLWTLPLAAVFRWYFLPVDWRTWKFERVFWIFK